MAKAEFDSHSCFANIRVWAVVIHTLLLPYTGIFLISCTPMDPIGGGPIQIVPNISHVYGAVVDKRDFSEIISDKEISLRIKQEIMHLRAKDGFFLNVYTFNGHVFLIGDPPDDFRELIVRFAIRQEGVLSLDYCFFPHNCGNIFDDALVEFNLGMNIFLDSRIKSSWIETEIYACNAVLLGVVPTNSDREYIEKLAKNTEGVQEVYSFILLDE